VDGHGTISVTVAVPADGLKKLGINPSNSELMIDTNTLNKIPGVIVFRTDVDFSAMLDYEQGLRAR